LLVDDHEPLLRAWRRLFSFSCEIVGAVRTGGAALAAVTASEPDVVVLDHLLPDANALDLCPRIMALAPNTRVVIVTASRDANLPSAANQAGAFAVVDKLGPDVDLELVIQRAYAEAAQ
jgi:DNA-binding NarL/FixJ family response regulator